MCPKILNIINTLGLGLYVAIVIVDYLDLKGNLKTISVISDSNLRRVVIDNLSDIYPGNKSNYQDIAGIRIYNSNDCKVFTAETKIRTFNFEEGEISFQFEHKGIPLYPTSSDPTYGYYNFILPAGFKLIDFHIVDPYDHRNEKVEDKKHFRYDVYWDRKFNTHLVRMELISRRGTFSFISKGKARIANDNAVVFLDKVEEKEDIIGDFDRDFNFIQNSGEIKNVINKSLAEKIDWLELKPNIMGIGVNFNQIIRNIIEALRAKLLSKKS